IRRDQHRDRPADHLLPGVSEYSGRALVPGRDDSVQVLAEDGIVRTGHDRGQVTEGLLAATLFGNVAGEALRMHVAPFIPHHAEVDQDRLHGAILAPEAYLPVPDPLSPPEAGQDV